MIPTHFRINGSDHSDTPSLPSDAMKSRLTITCATIIGFIFSSCYPIPGPGPKPGPQPNLTEEQFRQQELQRQRIAEQEAELLRQQSRLNNPNFNNPNPNPNPAGSTDYPFASKVPGKVGFVFSPYNKQVVDVRDIPSGTLVQDPTYPASEKKYFRVP